MKKQAMVIIAGLVLLATVAGVFILTQQTKRQATPTPTPTLAPTATPTPTPKIEIPEDWETYDSEEMDFSLMHPPEMNINSNQDGSVSFTLFGPSQKEGTEVYDGIILNFSTGTFEAMSFETFVETKHQEQVDDPIISSVTDIMSAEIDEKTGYKYTITSLGEFTIIYLPKNEGEYLRISMLVEDPKKQGFEETVDTLLSSLSY